jgi:hypothetical protein
MPFTVSPCCPLACKPLLCLYSEGFQSLRRLQENQGVMRVDPGGRNTLRRGPSCTGMFLARPGHFGPCDLCLAYCKLTAGKGMSSNCPNWSDRLLFLRVLIGISYDSRTFGIPRAFSDGIRAGNAVRLQSRVKLTHYSGSNPGNEACPEMAQIVLIPSCVQVSTKGS